jgi:predicted RNA binding protein YcfA (HicA-like mRNA interferase family)
MKREALLRYLREHGCEIVREGGSHTILLNPVIDATTAVPRHREIKGTVVATICNQLAVPRPRSVN